MPNPALTVAQPDIEAHLVTLLTQHAGVRVFVTDSTFNYPFWHTRYVVTVRCRAPSKQAASDTAWAVHGAVLSSPHEPWADGVLLTVDPVVAPAWSPDSNGSPGYAAEYQMVARPKGMP
jgi:hypothetical protein